MYTEVSSVYSKAVQSLYSPLYPYTGYLCITFWYHMDGRNIGTLKVSTLHKGKSSVVWEMTGI